MAEQQEPIAVPLVMRRPGEIFVGHQANLRVLQTVCEHADVPTDRHFWNVDVRGNCSSAGAPSVLSERWEQILRGTDSMVVVQVGGELSWDGFRLCPVGD